MLGDLAYNASAYTPVYPVSMLGSPCDETLDLLGSDPNNERVKGEVTMFTYYASGDLQG